jgi:hypothetical protein
MGMDAGVLTLLELTSELAKLKLTEFVEAAAALALTALAR